MLVSSLVHFATLGYPLGAEAVSCVWAELASDLPRLGAWHTSQLLWSTGLLQGLTPERWSSATRHLAARQLAGVRYHIHPGIVCQVRVCGRGSTEQASAEVNACRAQEQWVSNCNIPGLAGAAGGARRACSVAAASWHAVCGS